MADTETKGNGKDYVANFEEADLAGKPVKAGDPVDWLDDGTANFLLAQGRISEGTAPALGMAEAIPGDGESGESGEGDGFNADAFIDRNLDDISDEEILALTPEQRAAVREAEADREQPRVTLERRLDAADEASA